VKHLPNVDSFDGGAVNSNKIATNQPAGLRSCKMLIFTRKMSETAQRHARWAVSVDSVREEIAEVRSTECERGLAQVRSTEGERRGSALFKTLHTHSITEPVAHTVLLSIGSILPSTWQPRRAFDSQSLDLLADNIRQYGLLQPVSVRPVGGGRYELIAGERRLRACALIGESHIKATIFNIGEQDAALLTMAENLQREDLSFFEEAEGYRRLTEELHMTQQQLADKLGRQQSTIANKLRLLRLSAEVRGAIDRHGLTERHARALLRLHDERDQLQIIDNVVLRNLNVRQTEELVEKQVDTLLATEKEHPKECSQKFSRAWRDWRLFANSMKSAVDELKASGLDAQFHLSDGGKFVEMKVVVPKSR
jgi:ParB family transcriptional regulator, chromosome partitioning protein